MATYKTQAIVLGRHNLGEADRIVILLSADRGKLRAVAKGVRKTLSRQAGHIEPFSQADLMLAEGKNLDIITSARLSHYPANIVADYERVRLAYLMTQMIDRLSPDHGPLPGLFRLLIYCLHWLDEVGASTTLELFYKLRLLSQLGYKPQLEVCSNCGAKLTETYMSPEHGGVVCASCRSEDSEAISANQLGLWRRLYEADMGATTSDDDELAVATLGLCDTFYEYIFGRRFVATV